jgi:hypothetical protein
MLTAVVATDTRDQFCRVVARMKSGISSFRFLDSAEPVLRSSTGLTTGSVEGLRPNGKKADSL